MSTNQGVWQLGLIGLVVSSVVSATNPAFAQLTPYTTIPGENSTVTSGVVGGTSANKRASGIIAEVFPGATGAGGNITINTNRLIIQDAVVSSGTAGSGLGGTVTINALKSVEVIGTQANSQNPSGIFSTFVKSSGGNSAGGITITTRNLTR